MPKLPESVVTRTLIAGGAETKLVTEAQCKQFACEALEEVKTALLKEPTQLITRWKIAEIIEEVMEGL